MDHATGGGGGANHTFSKKSKSNVNRFGPRNRGGGGMQMKFFNFFRKNLSQKSTVLTKYQFFRPSDNPSLKIHLSFFANLSVNPNSGRVDAKNWGVDPLRGGLPKSLFLRH